ncbi:MAG: WD40 repeat domain-containing protein [Acidobacteria bacterium]|nr:WD40 repeat domain-containing protein [Acidobacteriota bacterium]
MKHLKLRFHSFILFALLFDLSGSASFSQDIDDREIFSQLRHTRRINAHGDEFMSMDMSPDKKRLAIGTEKGNLIVWNIESSRIEKQFDHGRPIHEVVFVGNEEVVVAGGNHTGSHNSLLGKRNIRTGQFDEWSGAGAESLMFLSFDERSGVLATASLNGIVTAWNTANGKRTALWNFKMTVLGLAVAGSSVYVSRSSVDLSEGFDEDSEISGEVVILSAVDGKRPSKTLFSNSDGYSTSLRFSPDKTLLAINLYDSESATIGFFDAATGKKIGSVEGSFNLKWIGNERILLSDEQEPLKFITINHTGRITTNEINKGGGFRGSGSPTDVSGQAVSSDERYVWHSFKKIGSLAQFDLKTKEAKLLIEFAPFPNAMDVREFGNSKGYIATAGDDMYARIWDLADLSLVREIKTDAVPHGIALIADGKRFIYSNSGTTSPSGIFTVDIATGERKQLLTIEAPYVRVIPAGDNFVYTGRVRDPKKDSTDTAEKRSGQNDEPKYVINKLILASADTGKTIREFTFDEGVSSFASSRDANWIAVADNKGFLWRINIQTGIVDEFKQAKIDMPTQIAITDDGRYIYTTEWYAKLKQWDTKKREFKLIVDGFRGQASSLRLSYDEKFAIIGGNHYDIGVYEIATGRTGFYTRVDASDFYVPHAWMKGDRLIYITDGGVMFDGFLRR